MAGSVKPKDSHFAHYLFIVFISKIIIIVLIREINQEID